MVNYNIKKKMIYCFIFIILTFSYVYSEDFFRVKQDILENFKRKFLGIYINSNIEINDAGYSSNIYSYEFSRKKDYIVDYLFNLNTAIIFKNKFILKIDNSPSYSYYKNNTEESFFFNNLNSSFYTYIGRFNFKYLFEKNQLNAIPTDEFGRRIRRDEVSHFFSTDYGNLNHFYINLFFNSKKYEFRNLLYLDMFDVRAMLNRKENIIGLSLNKMIFTSTVFSLGIDYFEHKFLYSPERDSKGINTFLSLSFRNRGMFTGSLRVGMKYFDSNNHTFKNYLLPFGSGQINLRVLNGLTITANYLLDISYSFTGMDIFYKTNSLRIGFNYRFNRQFRIEFRSRYSILNYKYLTYNFKYREDLSQNYNIVLRYFLSTRIQFGIRLQRFKANSTAIFYNRNADFIGGFLRFDL